MFSARYCCSSKHIHTDGLDRTPITTGMVLAAFSAGCLSDILRDRQVSLESDPFEVYEDVVFAAHRLRIHPESVKRLIRAGQLPARKFANKWFVRKDVLEQFAGTYVPKPGNRRRLL